MKNAAKWGFPRIAVVQRKKMRFIFTQIWQWRKKLEQF
jgi:hypothetical protein